MSNRWIVKYLLFLSCALLGMAFSWKGAPIPQGKCSRWPVVFWFSADQPLVWVSIEHRSFPVLLDLGLTGEICLDRGSVSAIAHKTMFMEGSFMGVNGQELVTRCFRVPRVQLGSEVFQRTVVCEEPEGKRAIGRFDNYSN